MEINDTMEMHERKNVPLHGFNIKSKSTFNNSQILELTEEHALDSDRPLIEEVSPNKELESP